MERPSTELNIESTVTSLEPRGGQRVGRAKKSLQLPLDPADYQAISDEADRNDLSMPEVVRRRLRSSTVAEVELQKIIDKVLALEDAGFTLTCRAQNGESIDLKPLSLFLLPATTRIPRSDPKP